MSQNSYLTMIQKAWQELLASKMQSRNFEQLSTVVITKEMYRSYLLETFFHTRQNPFSQLRCASHFPRDQYDLLKTFVQHALGEIKHDQMALADFGHIGGDRSFVEQNKPLPATKALIDYTFYLADLSDPRRYLAYLYHVEHLPTTQGASYLERLQSVGIPDHAMTFIKEHATVDMVHNRMMDSYLTYFCRSEAEASIVIDEFAVAMDYHFSMMIGAVARPILDLAS